MVDFRVENAVPRSVVDGVVAVADGAAVVTVVVVASIVVEAVGAVAVVVAAAVESVVAEVDRCFDRARHYVEVGMTVRTVSRESS